MIYLDENNELHTTYSRNESILYAMLQNVLLRRGEASFYANRGIDWFSIEQGYGNIDAELSSAIADYEPYCKSIDYTYTVEDSVLYIGLTVVFMNDEIIQKNVSKRVGYASNH